MCRLNFRKTYMFKILFLILCITLSTVSFSEATLKGYIPQGYGFYMGRHTGLRSGINKNNPNEKYFPEKHYDIYNLQIQNFSWIGSDKNTKQLLKLPGAYALRAQGCLDLESYDPVTGRYKFKLTINPSVMLNGRLRLVKEAEVVPVKVSAYEFSINKKQYLYVTGIAKFQKGQLRIENIHSNSDDSSYKFVVYKSSVVLQERSDIAMTIKIEDMRA